MSSYIKFAAMGGDGNALGIKTAASVDEVVNRWRTAGGAPFEVERDDGRRAFVNPTLVAYVIEAKGSRRA